MRGTFLLGLSVLILSATSPSAAQERLVMSPKQVALGKPFKVALPAELFLAGDRPADNEITYQWTVKDATTTMPFMGDAGIENLVDGKISTKLPVLVVKTPLKAKYRFEVIPSFAEEDAKPSVLEINAAEEPVEPFATETPAATGTPSSTTTATAEGTTTTSENGASSTEANNTQVWPKPLILEPGASQTAIGNRLKSAKAWWNANVIKEQKPAPVVGEDFIRLKLTEDRDRKFSLKEEIDTPLIAAARFYRAAYAAAEAKAEQAEETWKIEKELLLTQIEEDDQETRRALQLSRNFLEDLEAEIKRVGPNKFGQALREAAMMIGKLLLQAEQSRDTNPDGSLGGSNSEATATSSNDGDGYYGTSHAAVHHARAMSRIRMRNSRRMARIQSFQ